MAKPPRRPHGRPKKIVQENTTARVGVPREAKLALLVAIPFGIATALILSWSSLFPVAPEQLVEVVWRHQCKCANGWMAGLRAEGFVVQDFELDDIRSYRQQWHVPNTITGCHPASYLGYFLDGHLTAATLHRLAREHPDAVGIQQVDTVQPDAEGKPQIVGSQLLLVDGNGATKPWPEIAKAAAPPEPSPPE
ncbi:hypothetical protein ED208_11320 [Stagnimonas aquatica]|uniref:Uncharacterized protein n=1 Tax=Stagnimonas aquatica TaxID=2689987 RepID=A0A3N0VAH4_9GAMM|nr:DUF411 domain-containing protein [Stagnimonas aquatica]ROH89705.1 hypothetical protein ED208_11320 [Stagnimonas aquatica]